jgi:adenosyl cobinamide kinase/adenosyl cobinamide phosphate guanylyltransferase
MATRKTAAEVHTQLQVHEKMCEERWKTIYRKTDDLQASVNSSKAWLVGGLTTIVASLITLIVKSTF